MNSQIGAEQHAVVEEFRRHHRTELMTLVFTDLVVSTRLKQAVATLRGHTAPVSHLAFSPGVNTLATGSGDATIRL